MELKTSLLILLAGFIFGSILHRANLNKFNTISGMATLEDYTVAKAIAVAVGVGAILFGLETGLGWATFHIKPLLLTGILAGGLIFGVGMAVLGYCPGTMAISLGEGSLDALFGILGGLLAGLIYNLTGDTLANFTGPDLGKLSVSGYLGSGLLFYIVTIALGLLFIAVAIWLNRKERKPGFKWLYAGISLAILDAVIFMTNMFDRPLGASTSYPYLAGVLAGLDQEGYFATTVKSGRWEVLFLGGAFLAGLILSLDRRTFKIRLIHERWRQYKGSSAIKRIFWAFTGGFLVIFGARLAGGCTSGHVISGGMQLAFSSLLFGMMVFGALLLTGKLFYRK